MKKTIYILFLFVCLNSYANDTISTIVEDKQVVYVIKNQEQANSFDKILNYTKEILTIIGLIIGLGIGLPLLSRKLKEQQISKIIEDIYQSNKLVKNSILPLMNECIEKTQSTNIVHKDDLEDILVKIQNIEKAGINSNSQIVSLIFLTKQLFVKLIHNYNSRETALLTSNDVYYLLHRLLSEIDYFATYIVSLKGFDIKNLDYATKDLRKYTSNHKFKILKNPPQGLILHPCSITTIKYFQEINKSQNYLISRCAYSNFGNSKSIVRLLYLNKIYFPISLKNKDENENSLFKRTSLHLIKFNRITKISAETKEEVVELTYSNLNDFIHFVKSLKVEELKNKYVDDYITSKNIDLSIIKEIKFHFPETISFEIDELTLNRIFKENIRIIRKKMKNELKGK